jgi:pyruvate,water dikinase
VRGGRRTGLPRVGGSARPDAETVDRPPPVDERASVPAGSLPLVIALGDPRAGDPAVAGAKAANLARASIAGLPVLPGFVLSTRAFDPGAPGWPGAEVPPEVRTELERAWQALGGNGVRLVVRSSSTIEDVGTSSMAGQFRSLLDVVGWEALLQAVRSVLASSTLPTAPDAPASMAVLVQQQVAARIGGVLFGLDPVSGDRRHILVEVVPGGPESLVSGTVTAQRYLLGRRGRVIEGPGDSDRTDGDPSGGPAPGLLDGPTRRRLAALATRTARQFGRAQDVEWALDDAGQLWLLQSRPVTAFGSEASGEGPLLGPGPFAETFPDALRPLEEDIWLEPLRTGITSAIWVVGAVPRRALAASPLVLTVGGRVACDLALLGASPVAPPRWHWLDPRVPARRLASAWRIGRLRAVLPGLAGDLCRRVDTDLASVPALDGLSDGELLEVLDRARGHLAAVHGHEVLAGTLLPGSASTGAGVAMSVARRGRDLGLSDAQIIERWPVALALTAPRIGRDPTLPPVVELERGEREPAGATTAQVAGLPAREALRLRARWLQELTARAADLLALRLAAQQRLPTPASLVQLRLAELDDVVSGWPAPADLADRGLRPGAPLPSCFRLSPDGMPIPVRLAGAHRAGGRGAAQGRAQGRVVHDPTEAEPGDVLVTRTLDPRLAGFLPTLGAVVCETGSVLSHLAILAREFRVPTVVGVHDAVARFAAGSVVVVDGGTGEVRLVEGVPAAQGGPG